MKRMSKKDAYEAAERYRNNVLDVRYNSGGAREYDEDDVIYKALPEAVKIALDEICN